MNAQHTFAKKFLGHLLAVLLMIPALFLVNAYLTLPDFFTRDKVRPFLPETFFPPYRTDLYAFSDGRVMVIGDKTLTLYQFDSARRTFLPLATIPFEKKHIKVADRTRARLYCFDNNRLTALEPAEPSKMKKWTVLHFKKPLRAVALSVSADGKSVYLTADKQLLIVDIRPDGRGEIVRRIFDWPYRSTLEITPGILYAHHRGNLDIYRSDAGRPSLLDTYVTTLPRARARFSNDRKRLYLFHDKIVEIINIENRRHPKPFGIFHMKEPIVTILPESTADRLFVATRHAILVYRTISAKEAALEMKIAYDANPDD